MATFHGFKITNMKSWTGREGIGTSGNLVWNGHKLGEFIDYGDGGAPVYRFPTRELEAAIAEQVPEVGSLDMLVAILADMTETEKWLRQGWRRANKEGRVLASATDALGNMMSCTYPAGAKHDDIATVMRERVVKKGFDAESTEVTVWDALPELDEGEKVVSPEVTEAAKRHKEKVAKYRVA